MFNFAQIRLRKEGAVRRVGKCAMIDTLAVIGAAEQPGLRMSKLRVPAVLTVGSVLGLNPTLAQAGPCSNDIEQFEAAIGQSAGNPYAGLTAPQSIGAQLDRQPTPDSLKKTKERLQSKFSATMAKRLDEE
jgi:hypothetical protein